MSINIASLPIVPSTDVRDTTDIVVNSTDINGQPYTGRMTIDTFRQAALGGGMFSVSLLIPSAEILNMYATPKQFGLNVPSGYAAVPVGDIYMGATYAGVAYATNTSLRIRSVGGSNNFVSAVNALAFSADVFIPLAANAVSSGKAVIDGADWEIYVPAGAPTAGTSDIVIYAAYRLIEL